MKYLKILLIPCFILLSINAFGASTLNQSITPIEGFKDLSQQAGAPGASGNIVGFFLQIHGEGNKSMVIDLINEDGTPSGIIITQDSILLPSGNTFEEYPLPVSFDSFENAIYHANHLAAASLGDEVIIQLR